MNQKNKYTKTNLSRLVVVLAILFALFMMVSTVAASQMEDCRIQEDEKISNDLIKMTEGLLSDKSVLTEIFQNACENDDFVSSCYRDQRAWEKASDAKYFLDSADEWYYGDDARTNDKELYLPDGKMCGFTLSFKNKDEDNGFTFADSIINGLKDVKKDVSTESETLLTLSLNSQQKEALVKEKFFISSNKYKNSVFTVFVRIENKNNQLFVTDVYGQWNGYYLTKEKQKIDII